MSHANISLIYSMICLGNFLICFQNNLNIFILISLIEILLLIYLENILLKNLHKMI